MKEKLSKLFSGKALMIFLSFAGLYLLSTGASWAFFSFVKEEPELKVSQGGLTDTRAKIDPSLPKTEECPINGELFTKPEKEIWQTKRPITVIIENHADSRPASGISKADVVYEAVAEGGITRFLAVYYCGAAAQEVKVAPVRSARVYFVNWASEYGDRPIFMHVGGANDYAKTGETVRDARALELLESMVWRVPKGNDFDTTYDSGFPVFWRNYERLGRTVPTEHTMMASLDEAYKEAAKRGFTNDKDGKAWDEKFTAWKFSDDKPSSVEAEQIKYGFWENSTFGKPYEVVWKYDKATNSYLRENGQEVFKDLETGKQVTVKNVVVQFVKEKGPVDKNKHMLYTTIGKGDALIFQNGGVIKVSWEKSSQNVRTKFYDKDNKEISFVRGAIWISAIPQGNDVEY